MEVFATESERQGFQMQPELKTGVEEHCIRAREKAREHHEIEGIGSNTETKGRSPSNVATHLGPKSNLSGWWGCRTGGPRRDGTKSKNAFDPIKRMFYSSGPVCR